MLQVTRITNHQPQKAYTFAKLCNSQSYRLAEEEDEEKRLC